MQSGRLCGADALGGDELARRDAVDAAEVAIQRTLVEEAGFKRGFGNRQAGAQMAQSRAQPDLGQIGMRRQAGGTAEQADQLERTQAQRRAQIIQGEAFGMAFLQHGSQTMQQMPVASFGLSRIAVTAVAAVQQGETLCQQLLLPQPVIRLFEDAMQIEEYGDQFGIVTEANVQGAPAIVIEVLSPNTRKVALVTKRNLFERGGVREYWIVDPKAEVLKVFKRATGGSFPRAIALSAGDTLTTPILPGLTIAIVDLFGPL